MSVMDWSDLRESLHLQGQHDQKDHGNRGGGKTELVKGRHYPASDYPAITSDEDIVRATMRWANPGYTGGPAFDDRGRLPYVEMTEAANRAARGLPIRASDAAADGVGLLKGMSEAPLTEVPHYRATRSVNPERGIPELVSATPDFDTALVYLNEYHGGRGNGALIRFEPGTPHHAAYGGSGLQFEESIISGRFEFTEVADADLTEEELYGGYDLNSGDRTPVWSAKWIGPVEIPDVTETFHLQGGHDQSTHGNRGGTGSREVTAHPDGGYQVNTADGSSVRIHGWGLNDLTTQQRDDALNGVADAYDFIPTKGGPPQIEVVNKRWMKLDGLFDRFRIHAARRGRYRAADKTDDQISSSIGGFVKRDQSGTIFLNASANFDGGKRAVMPVGESMSRIRYNVMHEYGHAHFWGTETEGGRSKVMDLHRRQYKTLTPYGRSKATEGHAEAFVEWAASGGQTKNAAAKRYADVFGWDRAADIDLPLVAAAPYYDDDEIIEIIEVDDDDGPIVTEHGDDTDEFHLKGTANDHDQKSHARGSRRQQSSQRLIEDPLNRFTDVTLVGDDFLTAVGDGAIRAAAKFNGPISVANDMSPQEIRAVREGLGTYADTRESVEGSLAIQEAKEWAVDAGLRPDKYQNIPAEVVFQVAHIHRHINELSMNDYRAYDAARMKLDSIIDEFHTQIADESGNFLTETAPMDAIANLTYEMENQFGVSPAAGFIGALNHSWTESSQSRLSQAHQIAVATNRDLPFTSFRRYNGKEFDTVLAPHSMEWLGASSLGKSLSLYEEWQPAFDAVANATYRHTQRNLPPGLDDVLLYRGVKTSESVNTEYGDYAVETNPLSSWTTNPVTAFEFGGRDDGYVFEATVPRDMIYSSAGLSGLGSLPEWEAIITADDLISARVVNRGEDGAGWNSTLDEMLDSLDLAVREVDGVVIVPVDELDADWLKRSLVHDARAATFHLQGQHDQQTHGNRGTATVDGFMAPGPMPRGYTYDNGVISRTRDDLGGQTESFQLARPPAVEVTRTEQIRDSYDHLVFSSADGKVRVITSKEDFEWAVEYGDVRGYEYDNTGDPEAEFAELLVGYGEMGRQAAGLDAVTIVLPDYIPPDYVMASGWVEPDLPDRMNIRLSRQQQSAADKAEMFPQLLVDVMGSYPLVHDYAYTVLHETAHLKQLADGRLGRAHLENRNLIPSDTQHYWDAAEASGAHRNWMSDYGQTVWWETEAEAFAEWTNTGGTTSNPMVRHYADMLDWKRPVSAEMARVVTTSDWVLLEGEHPGYVLDGTVVWFDDPVERPETFHLAGTENDHDQSTHGGGGGGVATIVSPDDAITSLTNGQRVTVTPEDAVTVVSEFGRRDAGVVPLTNLHIDGFPLFHEAADEGIRERADMPQVPEAQIDNFREHLQAAGVAFTSGIADPTTIKSTQTELDATKVGQMVDKMRAGAFKTGHNPWVSSDNYILDGHHRWAAFAVMEAAKVPDRPPMDVTRVDMPIRELLIVADEFNRLHDVENRTLEMSLFLARRGHGRINFHLAGTENDHDQQSHAGGGGAPNLDDPGIRSDGQPFEFNSVEAMFDQWDGNFESSARFKHDGAANVTAYMTAEEKAEIADELNAITLGAPGERSREADMIVADLETDLGNFGLDVTRLPAGVAMQAASVAKLWTLETRGYDVAEQLQSAVEAFNAGGDPADLSAALEDQFGISVAHGAVDWRNAQWQSSAVTPEMVAFHLAAAESHKLYDARRALNGYYPSGAMEIAEEFRRMMPTTINTIVSADRFAVEDAIQMRVRRDSRPAEVFLYRGVKDTGHRATNMEGATAIQSNPLSSWTTDKSVAEQFAGKHSTSGGWIVEALVPVSKIVATSTVNGWGSLKEREVIVLGEPTEIYELTPVNKDRP